jgi:hypothetical protein
MNNNKIPGSLPSLDKKNIICALLLNKTAFEVIVSKKLECLFLVRLLDGGVGPIPSGYRSLTDKL